MVYGTNQKTKYSNSLEVGSFKFFALLLEGEHPSHCDSMYKLRIDYAFREVR